MAAIINILERPIERIRETCDLMGTADKFDRALPELETYLEEEIAAGETARRGSLSTAFVFSNSRFPGRRNRPITIPTIAD
jgi:hypothetical protein